MLTEELENPVPDGKPTADKPTDEKASDDEVAIEPAESVPAAVPNPGGPDSSAAPGTHAAAAVGAEEGKTASPGGWTAIAVPGSPDGEVDTRS